MKTLSSVLCECSVIHVEPGGLVLHKVEAMWIISLSLESDTLGHSELKLAQPLLLEGVGARSIFLLVSDGPQVFEHTASRVCITCVPSCSTHQGEISSNALPSRYLGLLFIP